MLLLVFGCVVSAIQFIHISDLHYDPLMDASKYDEHTDCRGEGHTMQEEVRLIYKKVPKPSDPTYGIFYCDANWALIEASVEQTYRQCPNPALILLTGDLAAHGLDKVTEEKTVRAVATSFVERFPGVPILFTLGNNDVSPHYYVECNDERYARYYDGFKDFIPSLFFRLLSLTSHTICLKSATDFKAARRTSSSAMARTFSTSNRSSSPSSP